MTRVEKYTEAEWTELMKDDWNAFIKDVKSMTTYYAAFAAGFKAGCGAFDLRWDADMRAIKRWQAEKPGRDLTWPNHADLVVWLLGELDKSEQAYRAAEAQIAKMKQEDE